MENNTMDNLAKLEKKLQELEKKIRETKDRLPAHSTKPLIMMELLSLEDEYDIVIKKIKKLKS